MLHRQDSWLTSARCNFWVKNGEKLTTRRSIRRVLVLPSPHKRFTRTRSPRLIEWRRRLCKHHRHSAVHTPGTQSLRLASRHKTITSIYLLAVLKGDQPCWIAATQKPPRTADSPIRVQVTSARSPNSSMQMRALIRVKFFNNLCSATPQTTV